MFKLVKPSRMVNKLSPEFWVIVVVSNQMRQQPIILDVVDCFFHRQIELLYTNRVKLFTAFVEKQFK
jgi:hypothetical protein